MKNFFTAFGLLLAIGLQAQHLNIQLKDQEQYMNDCNDIWGYTDAAGNEYAIVGTIAGTSIVDVTNPSNAVKKQFIPGPYSIWRDMKVWGHYAYIVHDVPFVWNQQAPHGLLIIDLDSINQPNARYKNINTIVYDSLVGAQDTLERAHNIWIDENGYAYLFGSNIGNGGALMYDLNTDPWNPVYVGNFNDYYLHDGMVRGDTLWGGAVNNGKLLCVDVSTKSAPSVLAQKTTPNSFTHNVWISDDNQTLFTTDEQPGAYLVAYDVSDLTNITELDRIQKFPGTSVIPHNAHVYGPWVVTSYYTAGVQIVDAAYPDLLVEVGYYDTSPNYSGNGFNGSWGAYPYFSSGTLVCSDIEEGLYVLDPEYVLASRVHVTVVDSLTGAPLLNAKVIAPQMSLQGSTNIDGILKLGTHLSGADTLNVGAAGYVPVDVNFNWASGAYDTIRVALIDSANFGCCEEGFAAWAYPNPTRGVLTLNWPVDVQSAVVVDATGRIIQQLDRVEDAQRINTTNWPNGHYFIVFPEGKSMPRIPVVKRD